MKRRKHHNDHNHGKNGMIGGNPRYGKARGNYKGKRAAVNRLNEYPTSQLESKNVIRHDPNESSSLGKGSPNQEGKQVSGILDVSQ